MAAIPWLPSWIRNWNLFALGASLPLIYLLLRWLQYHIDKHFGAAGSGHAPSSARQWGHQWRTKLRGAGAVLAPYQRVFHIFLASLFVVAASLAIWLEIHYADWCPISADKYQTNENALLLNMKLLAVSGFGGQYWTEFGTLLAVLRDLPIPKWDTDTDLSMIHPGDDELQAMLARFPEVLRAEGKLRGYDTSNAYIIYHPHRDLIQTHFTYPEAHGDIWLWREQIGSKRPGRRHGHVMDAPGKDAPPVQVDPNDSEADVEQLPWLYNDDYSIGSSPRLKSLMIPVRQHHWKAQHINISLPYDADMAAAFEYNSRYMTPLLYRIQCEENLFRGRLSEQFYAMFILTMVAAVAAIIRYWNVLPSVLPPPLSASRLALP